VLCAMVAAEYISVSFNTMADYLATAMAAFGRQFLDGALKAVECVPSARIINIKALIVAVAACIALTHLKSPSDLIP